jgi:regulatory protein YycI of two-component signal transduction system YycFG
LYIEKGGVWGQQNLNKKTLISLNLSSSELDLLTDLSEKKEMSKSAILRQALRMMAVLEQRIEQGEKFYVESLDKEKSEVLLF